MIQFNNCAPYSNEFKTYAYTKFLHMNIYKSFLYNLGNHGSNQDALQKVSR